MSFFQQIKAAFGFRYELSDDFIGLEDLAPVDNADQRKHYRKIITWALNNPNIKNIALTGSYGSGKSSVLKTYEKANPRVNLIYVSLATFNSSPDKLNPEDIANIEKSILQQIFYRVSQDQLPNSRFKRISNIKVYKYFTEATFATLISLSILYFYKPDLELYKFLFTNSELVREHPVFLGFLASCLILSGVVLYLKDFLQWIGRYSFWKVNIREAEIEVDQKHDSILNRYLDELLYFFERTSVKAVVIEDLDRFNPVDTLQLFTKLKEINTIINHYSNLNRKVTFIYAVKDDIFSCVNRTKFFDFIIPVIPVIDRSNSREKFIEKITQVSLKDKISPAFLADITLYIEDMRLLKNIFNEFVIYKNQIFSDNEKELTLEKLLAIIVYKNKYPEDFVKLYSNEGMIADAFKSKIKIAQQLILRIDSQLSALDSQIDAIHNEVAGSIEDLRIEYVSELYKQIPNLAAVEINGVATDFASLLDDQNFEVYRKLTLINHFTRTNPNVPRSSSFSFNDIELKVDPNFTFLERLKLVESKNSSNLEELIREKNNLEEKKAELGFSNLRVLLDLYKDENFFIGDIVNEDILMRLLRKGFIDESYDSYISHFYEGSLTRGDRDFLLSVKGQQASPDFYHKLTNVQQIIEDLEESDFSVKAILNIQLLDFLLTSSYKPQLDRFISQLCISGNPADDFIGSFWGASSKFPLLTKEICLRWDKYSDYVLSSHVLNHVEYIYIIFRHLDLDLIKTQDSNKSLSSFLIQMDDFFEFAHKFQDVTKLKEILSLFQIKLRKLTNPDIDREIFDHIYVNNLYEINIGNIESIISLKNIAALSDDALNTRNLSTVLQSGCEELINYIKQNLNLYFTQVNNQLPNNFYEDDSTLVFLLNDSTFTDENKTTLLRRTKSKIEDITKINEKDNWKELIVENAIKPTWTNVLAYFSFVSSELDEALIDFLNIEENYTSLQKIRIYSYISSSTSKSFKNLFEKIFLDQKLDIHAYEALISSYIVLYSKFPSLNTQTSERVEILLKHNKLSLSDDMFTVLKNDFNSIYAILIEHNFKEFMKSFSKYPLDNIGAIFLLKSKEITLANKISLINKLDVSLLDSHPEMVRIINGLLIKPINARRILLSHIPVLIKYSNTLSMQIMLFMSQIGKLNNTNCKQLITNFQPKISGLLKNGKPTLSSTKENTEFADQLLNLGLISSRSITSKGIKLNSKKS